MNKILKFICIMISFLTCLHAGHSLPKCFFGETEIQLDIPLLLEPDISPVVADMLFRIAYEHLSEKDKENSAILTSLEGPSLFYFKGEEESLLRFYRTFYEKANQMISEGVSNEKFLIVRSMYVEELRAIGALDKANAIDQLVFEEVHQRGFLVNTILITMGRLLEQVEGLSGKFLPLSLCNSPTFSNVVLAQVVQPQKDPCLPYYELRLTPSDSQNIAKLIDYLTMSKPRLLLGKSKVEKVGDDVRVVYPLRFIGHIVSTPNLKKKLRKNIEGSSFVWSGFIKGFGERMSKEKSHHTLDQYIPGFCQHLGISEQTVRSYIHQENWEGFVKFLIKNTQ